MAFTYGDIGGCNCTAAGCAAFVFTVFGCDRTPYPGVTVTLSGASGPIVSAVTDGAGQVTIGPYAGGQGPYTMTVTGMSSRFAAFSASGGSLTCSFLSGGGLQLLPAAGYNCTGLGCLLPASNTLHMTGGATETLTWNATTLRWSYFGIYSFVPGGTFSTPSGGCTMTATSCPPSFAASCPVGGVAYDLTE
jgi:hypothetical protein